ncbi:MAG: hypothetical protein AB7D51_08665 [Desulfovibrionaceae bacterium]
MAKRKTPPLFDDVTPDACGPDPVSACLGPEAAPERGQRPKAKAGYYLPEELLQRLEETWLKLRLAREPVQSKSQLVELALELLLAELEAGERSRVLALLRGAEVGPPPGR